MKIAQYFQQDKFVLAGSGQYSSVRFAIPCITISIFGYILARHRSVNDLVVLYHGIPQNINTQFITNLKR